MKNGYFDFICHLTGIFIMRMFLTDKMAFDGHDTRQIPALSAIIYLMSSIIKTSLSISEMSTWLGLHCMHTENLPLLDYPHLGFY